LGRYGVPNAVRAYGHVVHTLWSVYGDGAELFVDDLVWAEDAHRQSWVVLTGDASIRRYLGDDRMYEYRLSIFALPRNNLRGAEQIHRIVSNLDDIVRIANESPRPHLYGIYADGLRQLWPR